MKVERILYGMQTSDGKILLTFTAGAKQMLTQKSIDYIRQLKPKDSKQYLWFKSEQTIAYPHIVEVADKDPKHGGRTWVQNQTFLVNLHEFISYTQAGKNPFQALEALIAPAYETFPEDYSTLTV